MLKKLTNTRTNGDKARDNIIAAAKVLFAKKGFAGTSIMQIAAKAKVTKALVFHHFKNKEELWKMVKASFLSNLTDTDNKEERQYKTLQEFIEQIINQRFDLYNQNPDVVRMMIWQGMEKKNSNLQGGTSASPGHWISAIKQLQKQGEIKRELDPELIVVFIASTISGAFVSNLSSLNNEKKKQIYRDMAIDLLIDSLAIK
jgi:AcrR family transcriptional regulator